MNLQAAKLDLVEKILNIRTETIIEKLNKILDKEMIVGYTVEGKPLTKKAYNKRLEKAEQDVLNGRVTSSEDLKKEMKSWRK
tara:strand:+ start:51586 stop:51831 length:246 start_codon:yes stop_codon:yes gene_type:complete